MRRIRILLSALTVVTTAALLASVGLAFENEPEGFRDLRWGDPPTDDMVYRTTLAGDRIYTRPNDKMYIGNAQFMVIAYDFYGQPEKLMAAYLYFKGEKTFNLLKAICRTEFGKERQEAFYELGWWGPKAIVKLRYHTREKAGYLCLMSAKMLLEKIGTKEQREMERARQDP